MRVEIVNAWAEEQAQKIVNGWANQRIFADHNVDLRDLRDRIARALAEKDAELAAAREAMVFLREQYSPIGARACPACLYEGGTFIRWCKLHEEIAAVRSALSLARPVVEAARTRLLVEGHSILCRFTGCTCGHVDEAQAARQDVQRALAAYDAEEGRRPCLASAR